ncbi:MAG TPA: hypothetical protein VKB56_13655, partial [Terriglobales bacterium]|nr:hypothetical protein [Terriglobales bacterium]
MFLHEPYRGIACPGFWATVSLGVRSLLTLRFAIESLARRLLLGEAAALPADARVSLNKPANLFRGRGRRYRNPQTVDEAREHFKSGRSEEEFDPFGLRKSSGQLGEKCVIDSGCALVQAIGKAEAQFLLFRVGARFKM